MAIVFQDLFTNSGSDTDIASWQSTEQASGSPDWAYQSDPWGNGVTNAIIADDTSDKATCGPGNLGHFGTRDYTAARLINAAGTASDDYTVAGVLHYENLFENSYIAARLHASQLSGYAVGYHAFNGATLYKFVNGVPSSLDSDSACTTTGNLTITLDVLGSQITWSAIGVGGGSTPTGNRVVTDSSYATGPAGFIMRSAVSDFGVPSAAKVFIDNFEVSTASAPTTLTATTNTITLSAPTAVLAGVNSLSADPNTITLTAPTIPAIHLMMPVTANVITLSAPTVTLREVLNRKFPLVRLEMDAGSQFSTRAVPAVAYQDTSLIP